MLVLEDLHWADEATLDVLRLLGRRVDEFRALIVGTYRDDELAAAHPLRVVLGELARTQGVARLDIARLSPAVAALAEPYEVDADELYRSTGGNPFFVSEVLAAGTKEIPATVRDAVLARFAGLSPVARTLLEALAVASPSAKVGVLEAIAGEAIECLEECIGAGLVGPATVGVAFRHELARLVIDTRTVSPAAFAVALALPADAGAALTIPPIHEPFTPLPCMGKAEQRTTTEQEGCAEQQILKSDKRIDALDGTILGDLGSAAAKRRFIAAHTAWLAYRRAYCISRSDVAAGGTEAPVVAATCAVALNGGWRNIGVVRQL